MLRSHARKKSFLRCETSIGSTIDVPAIAYQVACNVYG